MSVAETERQLIEDLNLLPDPQEKLAVLIQRSERHQLAESLKTPEKRVPGCVSGVWVEVEADAEGRLQFTCDADSPMVKGLAALLCDVYSGAAAEDVRNTEPSIWQATRLHTLLSPTRLNGLGALRQRIVALSRD